MNSMMVASVSTDVGFSLNHVTFLKKKKKKKSKQKSRMITRSFQLENVALNSYFLLEISFIEMERTFSSCGGRCSIISRHTMLQLAHFRLWVVT